MLVMVAASVVMRKPKVLLLQAAELCLLQEAHHSCSQSLVLLRWSQG